MTRRIWEAIHIRKREEGESKATNLVDVTHFLDHVYDPLLTPTLNPRNENNYKPRGKRSGVDQIICDQTIRLNGEI